MNYIVKARIDLLREQPFFGRLALLLDVVETSLIPTACTDGERLMYNQDFTSNLTSEARKAVVLHEVLHVALGHLWRKGNRIPHLWNYATDYAVNAVLIKNNLPVPEHGLYNQEFSDKSAEQIYEILKKKSKDFDCGFHSSINLKDVLGDGDQEGEGSGEKNEDKKEKDKGEGDGNGESKSKKKSKGKGEGGQGQGDQDGDSSGQSKKAKCPVCESHQFWGNTQANPKKAKQIQKKFEATMEQIAKNKGNIPAGFERLVEELTPKEDWKKILVNYLSSSISDFDFMRRDRRTLSWPFYIPDLRSEDKLENLVVAVDTSGSIGQEELSIFLTEIRQILKTFPNTKGWMIDCDASVHQVIEIDKAEDPKVKFYGGGGTSHKPVFAEIKKREIKPKVMICFTDLYTDFPSQKPDYPVLWLTIPESSSS